MKIAATILLLSGLLLAANADELTMMVEKDLAALGYDTGPVDGEETMETVIAISKFQAENNLDVTGEVTPQLAGTLSAKAPNPGSVPVPPPAAAAAASTAATDDAAALQAAQQACLERKMAKAQEKAQTKRGLGRLMSAVTRTASQQGNYEVSAAAGDIYNANATADDLAAAAKDLGLSKNDIDKCQNPDLE
jgi:peptidoglycan hydrolase-like protein with peptidoglycan-binding domain